jgi:hypothetical protein
MSQRCRDYYEAALREERVALDELRAAFRRLGSEAERLFGVTPA